MTHCGNCQKELIHADRGISPTGFKHKYSGDEPGCCIYPELETLEQERDRVWGTCGGKCGEAPCIAYNEEKARRLAHQARRAKRKIHSGNCAVMAQFVDDETKCTCGLSEESI